MEHDNFGFSAGWFLDKVNSTHKLKKLNYMKKKCGKVKADHLSCVISKDCRVYSRVWHCGITTNKNVLRLLPNRSPEAWGTLESALGTAIICSNT